MYVDTNERIQAKDEEIIPGSITEESYNGGSPTWIVTGEMKKYTHAGASETSARCSG